MELPSLIRGIGQDVSVYKVERLRRKVGQDWVSSNLVKITFNTTTLPPAITIAHSYYKVRPFFSPPLQCFRCQRLGHTALGCRAAPRCLICGGGHSKETCSTVDPYCCNCRGTHKANSILCPLIQAARERESLGMFTQPQQGPMSMTALPLLEQHIHTASHSHLRHQVVPVDVHRPFSTPLSQIQSSYSDVVRGRVTGTATISAMGRYGEGDAPRMVDVGIQTDPPGQVLEYVLVVLQLFDFSLKSLQICYKT